MTLWIRRLFGRVRYRVVTFGEKFYCQQGPEARMWLHRPADGRWFTLSANGEFDSWDVNDSHYRKYIALFDSLDDALEALYTAIGKHEYRKPSVRAEFVP